MEIDELKNRKAQLESEITDLIAKFEDDFKIDVSRVFYSKSSISFDNRDSRNTLKTCSRETKISVML